MSTLPHPYACFRCEMPMSEDDFTEVELAMNEFLDTCQSDVGERFVERLLRGSEKARPDQMVNLDPVVCMHCFTHIRKGH